jgi:hypothetical protein
MVLPPAPTIPRVLQVGSFHELVSTPFTAGVNALCWQRSLQGDFAQVVSLLAAPPGITTLDEEQLLALPASAAGRAAIAAMLADLQLLREHGLEPVLDCINGYLTHDDPGPLRTDVCSFHADSATVAADTYLCTYHGLSSEGLPNEEAVRHVDVPETRAMLLQHYGGADDEGFAEYLSDHFYDLHYAALPQAKPYAFGLGNLWRIAIAYPGSPALPCIHRAPDPVAGAAPRLLLIS